MIELTDFETWHSEGFAFDHNETFDVEWYVSQQLYAQMMGWTE